MAKRALDWAITAATRTSSLVARRTTSSSPSSSGKLTMSTAVNNKCYVFPPPETPCVPVQGSDLRFPVRRIYCVGRNYADHAVEMGGDPSREPPFFFSKPPDAVVVAAFDVDDNDGGGGDDGGSSDADRCCTIPYPLATEEVHHEVELVVAIGKGGDTIPLERAMDHVFGFGVGIDLTRRDLQAIAKERSRPWDCSKGFDRSAPVGALLPRERVKLNDLTSTSIWLDVDGVRRQDGTIGQMTWSIPEIVSILSTQFQFAPGDLIFTGTPSGVGPLRRGQVVTAAVEGIGQLRFRLG